MLLRHIHYFLAVADQNSFTRAAESLYVSQPALSQQIRQLEERLGCQLFDRSGRRVVLTDVGEVYYRYARKALQDLAEGERALLDVQDLSRGSLRLAVTPTFISYLVGPLVARFYQAYPGIRLEIQEMSQEQIEEALLDDRLDLGIAFDRVHSPELAHQQLLQETLALVVNRQHPLAADNSKVADKEVLQGLEMALLNSTFATREQIDAYCLQHELTPQVVMQANSLSAVLEVVRCAPLATLLPADIAHLQQELVPIALQPTLLQRQAVLLWRKGAYRSAAAEAFSAEVQSYCAALAQDAG